MKKTICGVLAVSVALSICAPVFAKTDDIQSTLTAASEEKVYSISLKDAIEMAYKDNAKLNANLMTQKGNQANATSANDTRRELKNTPIRLPSQFELLCAKKGYYYDAAKTAHNISIKEYDQIKAGIAYDVTEAYYNLVLIEKLLNAAKNSYDLALENQKVVDAQYKLGLIPEIDYKNANVTLKMCENALEEYRLNYEIAHSNLKIHLNKDLENCVIIPTDEIECEEYTSDVEKDIASAMESRFDLYSLSENRKLAESYFDISTSLSPGSALYNTAYASFINADYNYENAKKMIALSIKSSYNKVITTSAKLETAKLQYEVELNKYDAAKLKFELGMISNLELTKCINDLYTAQVNYANSKLSYRLAVEKYKYEITIG